MAAADLKAGAGPRVAIAGIGLMGSQIAMLHALAGDEVIALVRDHSTARQRLSAAAGAARAVGLNTAGQVAEALARIHIQTSGDPLAAPVHLVVESLVESAAVKVATMRPIADALPDAYLATNTSSLSITELGEQIGAPERLVGMHYWNPPLLMPLVEVVAGAGSGSDAVEFVRSTTVRLGKRPVLVRRDVPGFVWNRLQFALLREALWLVERGVADPEEVDLVVREGLARRLRFTGPLETAALGGLETFERVAGALFPNLSMSHDATALKRHVQYDATTLERAQRRRDDGLAAELMRDQTWAT